MVCPVPRVVVVGAGVGGLACALELAASGCEVVVLERGASAGGKMRTVGVGGAAIDGGPTVLTMRWVFEELFEAVRASLHDHVQLERAEVLARHAWPDGARLDLFADRDRSAAAIGEVFGAHEARAYLDYWEDGRRIYDAVVGPFLRSQRPTFAGILKRTGILGLGALTRIDAFRTMWSAISQRFETPHLRQLFGRYATYCGSSPFEAPGTLSLVPYVEAEGVFRVRGGMGALGLALERLARSCGVQFGYGQKVEEIVVRSGRAAGVLAGGVHYEADAVVFNGDVNAVGRALLGRDAARAVKPTPPEARSLSAVTWAVVGKTAGLPLVHHNVMFSDDYEAEFDAIFRARRVPEMPTVYLCAQDRGDVPHDLPEERMLLVINAPATGDEPALWSESERKRCEETTFAMLSRCGLHLTPRAMEQTTPVELDRLFPATGGALYGPISRGPFSALSRQGARSKVPGLYLAGGSVHPGPGVPMAVLSGRLAASQVRADLASTGPSRTAVTHGTTSTR